MTAATALGPGRLSLQHEGFEYARARIGARLGWRPAAAGWARLQAARGLGAWIAVARSAPCAPYVSGVGVAATLDEIDAAFRAQWRQRVEELARWAPPAWRPALRWTAVWHDLPLLLHLQHGGAAPAWVAQEPDLASAASACAWVGPGVGPAGRVQALALAARDGASARAAAVGLPPPLMAWAERWRRTWPADRGVAALARWAARRGPAWHGLGQAVDADAAEAAAAALAGRLLADLRGSAAWAPCVIPFAFLALLGLDLRRLRASAVQAWWAQGGYA